MSSPTKWDDSYDPHIDRHVERGLTNCESLAQVLGGVVGTGVLAIPAAFYSAGMINGIVLLTVLTFIFTYCFHLLVSTQYILCKIKKVPFLNYSEAMEAAFEVGPKCLKKIAPHTPAIADTFFVILQLGALCAGLIFMGDNVKTVCDQYLNPQPISVYLLMMLPFCAALMCVRNMKSFAPFSIFGNIVTFSSFGVMCYYVCQDLPEFTSRPFVGNWMDTPLVCATIMFSLLSVPVVVTVENQMNHPKFFLAKCGTLNIAFGLVLILYMTVGVMGYWKYGSEIKSTFILNFPDEEILAIVIRALFSLAIFLTYGLHGMVAFHILWNSYFLPRLEKSGRSSKVKYITEFSIRLGIVFITFGVSMMIPFFGLVIPLFGGLCLSLLGVSFPALMELCALWPDHFGRFKWKLWKDLLLIIMGLFIMTTSFYESIEKIVDALINNRLDV